MLPFPPAASTETTIMTIMMESSLSRYQSHKYNIAPTLCTFNYDSEKEFVDGSCYDPSSSSSSTTNSKVVVSSISRFENYNSFSSCDPPEPRRTTKRIKNVSFHEQARVIDINEYEECCESSWNKDDDDGDDSINAPSSFWYTNAEYKTIRDAAKITMQRMIQGETLEADGTEICKRGLECRVGYAGQRRKDRKRLVLFAVLNEQYLQSQNEISNPLKLAKVCQVFSWSSMQEAKDVARSDANYVQRVYKK